MRLERQILENAKRLRAPESLRAKVMEEIGKPLAGGEPPRRIEKAPRRCGWRVVVPALAAALIMAMVRLAPTGGGADAPGNGPVEAELAEFVNDALAPVFSQGWGDVFVARGGARDVERFLDSSLKDIFWINGGHDNA